MRKFKDTHAAKGSALFAALLIGDSAAKRVYNETTARFSQLHTADDREWFNNCQAKFIPTPKE